MLRLQLLARLTLKPDSKQRNTSFWDQCRAVGQMFFIFTFPAVITMQFSISAFINLVWPGSHIIEGYQTGAWWSIKHKYRTGRLISVATTFYVQTLAAQQLTRHTQTLKVNVDGGYDVLRMKRHHLMVSLSIESMRMSSWNILRGKWDPAAVAMGRRALWAPHLINIQTDVKNWLEPSSSPVKHLDMWYTHAEVENFRRRLLWRNDWYLLYIRDLFQIDARVQCKQNKSTSIFNPDIQIIWHLNL